jgi:uncharacterized protein HemX
MARQEVTVKKLILIVTIAAIGLSTVSFAQTKMEHKMMAHKMAKKMEHKMMAHKMAKKMEHKMMAHKMAHKMAKKMMMKKKG